MDGGGPCRAGGWRRRRGRCSSREAASCWSFPTPASSSAVSTTARFYAIVRPLRDELSHDSWAIRAWAWTDVKVTSPQLSREATYKLSLKKSTLQLTSARESANPFVEQAVQFSVAAAKVTITDKEGKDAPDKLPLQGLHITILGFNDFYSYRKQFLGEPGTGGSSTPSMVGSVKQCQKSDPHKSKDTLSKLGMANSMLENQLRNLNKLAEDHWESYESVLRSCSRLTCSKWTEVD
ncbi:hypothetical protein ABZP36_018220 [Zizania latifolia]